VVIIVVLLDFLVKDAATEIFARVEAYKIDGKDKLKVPNSVPRSYRS